mgnify:CR=1 FL=1
MSHPTWVRGLKSETVSGNIWKEAVAPYMGAWIEIIPRAKTLRLVRVAPYMGAWIEITSSPLNSFAVSPSHPTWVRGLKSIRLYPDYANKESHPTWVRGLK